MRRVLRTIIATGFFASSLAAQQRESPVAFDSAGRITSLTPAVVARLGLTPPVWPVAGSFVEARLFAIRDDGYVITVQLAGGSLDRYALSGAEREALSRAITAAMSVSGRLVSEERAFDISEPARGAYLRNQMILTAALYAPLAATLTHDGKAGGAVWLLGTGASYFALSSLTRNQPITRAQNTLATDGAIRGLLLANAALAVASTDPSSDAHVAASLIGSVGGAVTGTLLGRRWTDSEANSATFGSSAASLTSLGVLGAAGVLDSGRNIDRAIAATTALTGVAGYALGVRYPKIAPYRVTAGDVSTLRIPATIGILAGTIPQLGENPDGRTLAATMTVGGLAGLVLGERLLARRFDHTEADAWRLWLGAIAGGLVGGGVSVLGETNATIGVSLVSASATAGLWLAHRLVAPERARR